MKKIIIATIMMICTATTYVTAYNNNKSMNTEEYVSMLNNNIGELNEQRITEQPGISNIFFDGGLEEGYIKPNIEHDKELRGLIKSLSTSIKATDIMDRELQKKHNLIVSEMEELVKLLDSTIEGKQSILEMDSSSLEKAQQLMVEDGKKIDSVNIKIDSINQIYKEINNFVK